MRTQVIKISTAVFRKLQKCNPDYMSLGEEKPGPTQRILVAEDVYFELIDLAIAKRKTLDVLILEVCTNTCQGQDILTTAATASKANW